VFSQNGTLRLVPFDPVSGTTTGSVRPAEDGVQWTNQAGLEGAAFAVSRTGDLVFIRGERWLPEMSLVWVDRAGRPEPVDVAPAGYVGGARLSPSEGQIALARLGETGVGEIWVMDADGTRAAPVAKEGANYNPVWTPNGAALTYTSNGNLFERPVDRDEERSALLSRDGYLFSQSWSASGRFLAFMQVVPTGSRLGVMPRDGEPELLLEGSFNSGAGRFSPVDDLLAYVTDQSGQAEVYVRRYPGDERGLQVSRGGGGEPVWSGDGRELFYRRGDRMMAVQVTAGPVLSASPPAQLWEDPYFFQNTLWPSYDVGSDGRFLMLEPVTPVANASTELSVVLGWLADVERRAF
jgi:serine/threonine-protein kinase